MMRYMSFFVTTNQVRKRTKTVTRRKGWQFLTPGEVVTAVVRYRGVKREDREELGLIKIISARQEPLQLLTDDPEYGRREMVAEGFPNMPATQFVTRFCKLATVSPGDPITRIEFEYVDDLAETTQKTTPSAMVDT